MLFLASLVMMGTSIELCTIVADNLLEESVFGVSVGAFSTAACVVWIFVHYNFIQLCKEGGWLELGSGFFFVLLWITAVALLTQDGGIAATIGGSGCSGRGAQVGLGPTLSQSPSCNVTYIDPEGMIQQVSCGTVLDQNIPGSNLYFASWAGFGASLNICFRWKAQQAIKFAQARNDSKSPKSPSGDGEDDLDEFEDADLY